MQFVKYASGTTFQTAIQETAMCDESLDIGLSYKETLQRNFHITARKLI